jgi:hypothetical protein
MLYGIYNTLHFIHTEIYTFDDDGNGISGHRATKNTTKDARDNKLKIILEDG